jgi:hypothetical protein
MTRTIHPSVTVGYLVPVDQYGYSTHPNTDHPDTAPVRTAFWCPECVAPCDGSPIPAEFTPVHRVNIGIYSQVCDACNRLVVDGVYPVWQHCPQAAGTVGKGAERAEQEVTA